MLPLVSVRDKRCCLSLSITDILWEQLRWQPTATIVLSVRPGRLAAGTACGLAHCCRAVTQPRSECGVRHQSEPQQTANVAGPPSDGGERGGLHVTDGLDAPVMLLGGGRRRRRRTDGYHRLGSLQGRRRGPSRLSRTCVNRLPPSADAAGLRPSPQTERPAQRALAMDGEVSAEGRQEETDTGGNFWVKQFGFGLIIRVGE